MNDKSFPGKKLIEVALPLDAINDASAYDKMPGIGPHPKGVHKWWAPLPLPAARAVLFASLIDDPSSDSTRFPTDELQEKERDRLFELIRRLVAKDATSSGAFSLAREELARVMSDNAVALMDPFCGGGAIPLEGQRLGLRVHASDLNPIAVLLSKALIEIPARFVGSVPVNPRSRSDFAAGGTWPGSSGLAADVRYFAEWMLDEARGRIGHLYPDVQLPAGGRAAAIAWIWTRTVRCPNPACGAEMPLASSFVLSNKKGKEAWIQPIVQREDKRVDFQVVRGRGGAPDPPKIGRGAKFRCLVCDQVADDDYLKEEGRAKRLGRKLMAVVAQGDRSRSYVGPSTEQTEVADSAVPEWLPDQELAIDPRNIWCVNYGLVSFSDLFTARQLVALTTLSDLVAEALSMARAEAVAAGLPDDGVRLVDGGSGADAYADAVATYLAFGADRTADFSSTLCRWVPSNEKVMNTFGRQAIPMIWDFGESNVLGESVGSFKACSDYVADCLETVIVDGAVPHVGEVHQLDAATALPGTGPLAVSTDPPYYDNIGYSDLSDFFYVWLRRSAGSIWPNILSTLLAPKAQELIANPYRQGGMQAAKEHFETGLRTVFARVREVQDPAVPLTVYYAFKQSDGSSSSAVDLTTGWETILEALLASDFQITGTWPIRASQSWRMTSMGTNALASYIVLVCRPRNEAASVATRREYLNSLRAELPRALFHLQHGNIAPVDLAQAAIGPGMAVFSRYAKVVEASGERMQVRAALGLINQVLDEVLTEQEGDFDPLTRAAIAWFESYGVGSGPYGEAQVLAQAKGTTPEALHRQGFLDAKGGKVRLLSWQELPAEWNPATDDTLTYWEATHYLIRAHQDEETGSEVAAAELLQRIPGHGELARELAYRLFRTCEARKWVDPARSYNALVIAWPEIARLAEAAPFSPEQTTLGGQ